MTLIFKIFLVVLSVSLFSCVKPPSTAIEYGPEVAASEVAAAVNDAIGPDEPQKINLNEYTETQTTRLIRGRSVVDILSRTGVSVTQREVVSGQIQFYYVEDSITYDLSGQGNDERITRDFKDCINETTFEPEACISAPATTSVSNGKNRTFDENGRVNTMAIIRGLTASDNAKTTYHNLVVTRTLEAPPENVKNFENCMGIPDCKIHYINISYDFVDWSTAEGNKIAIKLKVSPDVPYLSRLMDKCQQGSIVIPQKGKPASESPRYLLTFCDTVRNFRFGTASN